MKFKTNIPYNLILIYSLHDFKLAMTSTHILMDFSSKLMPKPNPTKQIHTP